jgi:hypothetical protein
MVTKAGSPVKLYEKSSDADVYEPHELKTLFEALQIAPSWMSKRFIMKELCGWDDKRIEENVKLRNEEEQQNKMGNRVGAYK